MKNSFPLSDPAFCVPLKFLFLSLSLSLSVFVFLYAFLYLAELCSFFLCRPPLSLSVFLALYLRFFICFLSFSFLIFPAFFWPAMIFDFFSSGKKFPSLNWTTIYFIALLLAVFPLCSLLFVYQEKKSELSWLVFLFLTYSMAANSF